jgi:hypothetical protein
MLGQGWQRQRLEKDAAIVVLPHQVSLIWMVGQHYATITIGFDQQGFPHVGNISDKRLPAAVPRKRIDALPRRITLQRNSNKLPIRLASQQRRLAMSSYGAASAPRRCNRYPVQTASSR